MSHESLESKAGGHHSHVYLADIDRYATHGVTRSVFNPSHSVINARSLSRSDVSLLSRQKSATLRPKKLYRVPDVATDGEIFSDVKDNA